MLESPVWVSWSRSSVWLEVRITLQLTADVSQLVQLPCVAEGVWGGEKKPFISSALFIHCYVADTLKSLSVLSRNAYAEHLTVIFLLGRREVRDLKTLFTRQLQVWIHSLSANWGFGKDNSQWWVFQKGQTELSEYVRMDNQWHGSLSKIFLQRGRCVMMKWQRDDWSVNEWWDWNCRWGGV